MSTPSSSASGNIMPASMTMMSSPYRRAIEFIPNSPRPPNGITSSLRSDIEPAFQAYQIRTLVLAGTVAFVVSVQWDREDSRGGHVDGPHGVNPPFRRETET